MVLPRTPLVSERQVAPPLRAPQFDHRMLGALRAELLFNAGDARRMQVADLSEDLRHDFAVHVGQPEIAARVTIS